MATLTFGERVSLQDTQTGHSGDYFVVGESFRWSPREGLVDTFTLRAADTFPAWLIGTSKLGQDTAVVY